MNIKQYNSKKRRTNKIVIWSNYYILLNKLISIIYFNKNFVSHDIKFTFIFKKIYKTYKINEYINFRK